MTDQSKITIFERIIFIGLLIYAISATTSTTGQTAGVILAFIGWIIRMIVTKKLEIIGTPLNIPILFFIITLFVATIFSAYPTDGLERTESIIRKLALYYLVVCGIKDLLIAKRLIIILLVATTISAAYIICQHFWDFKLFGVILAEQLSENRTLGGLLGIIFPLAFSLFLFSQTSSKKIIFSIASLLILTLLLLTCTRGAWMGVLVAIIFIGIFRAKKMLFFLPLIFIILILLSPRQISSELLSMFDPRHSANTSRIYIFKDTLNIIKDYPLTGVGPGSFEKIYYTFPTAIKESGHKHCHNNFLNVAAEGGLLSLGAFIWLIIASFSLAFKVLKKTSNDKEVFPITIGLFAGLIVWLVHGMVDCTYLGSTAYLFSFILGMMVLFR